MTKLTPERFEEFARISIEQAVYASAQKIGRFLQAIWLMKVPDSPDQGPITGMAVEIPGGDATRYAQAYARQQVQKEQPDFTIVAGYAVKTPTPEAVAKALESADKDSFEESDMEYYGFYCQAPGLEPITFVQYFHRDAEGMVVLDGSLKRVKHSFVAGSMGLDPWLTPTDEDRSLISEGKMAVVDPKVLDKSLSFSALFPQRNIMN
jgi:hypothetical protein